MRFAGVLPPDAPDPRDEMRSRLGQLAFPLMSLVTQPTVEDNDEFGTMGATGATAVSFSYTLWRNPDDRDDPMNLATLDARTAAALEEEPPWPRPDWLIEAVGRMRYPSLWEAVRTSWNRDSHDGLSIGASEIDTDPFVYAIGARLAPDLVTTVVIAREHLPYVRIALTTRDEMKKLRDTV